MKKCCMIVYVILKVPLGYHKIRKNDIENERLKNLVDNNRPQIRNYIREIVNIYFKNDVIDEWIDAYLNRRYYEYKGVDDRNLPYSILVTHQAINIWKICLCPNVKVSERWKCVYVYQVIKDYLSTGNVYI